MKEVKAYIHANRIADVTNAVRGSGLLARGASRGVRNMNATVIQSLLKPVDSAEQHYSMALGEAVIDEIQLDLLCEDEQVDAVVAVIEETARTGQALAGWICVSSVEKAIPIRGKHK